MSRKILVRLVGALTCMAAVVTGFDAEAGWRHRRCCSTPCYTSCYTPCYTTCASPCYDSCGYVNTCSTWRDACGYCHTSCGWTVVSTPVVVSDCCTVAAKAAPAPATATAAKPAATVVTPTSAVR